jgi:nicotinamide riboside kinase
MKKNYKKYGIIGSHCAGKSTFALRLAFYLRTEGYNVDTVQERVRYSPFPFNENSVIETCHWLYHSQICRELEAVARGFNYIVCDRTAIDCILYAGYHNLSDNYFEVLKCAAYQWMNSYDKLFFLRPNFELIEDGVRSPEASFRNDMDLIFLDFVKLFQKNHPEKIIYHLNSNEIFDNDFKYEWIND